MWSLTVALVLFVSTNNTVGMVPAEITYRVPLEEQCQEIRRAYNTRPLNNAFVIFRAPTCEREAGGRER